MIEGKERREIVQMRGFPTMQDDCPHRYKNSCTIGIGGNIGDVPATFAKLAKWFGQNPDFCIAASAPLYYNPPFGYKEQPWYYNSIIQLSTNHGYYALFGICKYLERRFGRTKKSFPDAPRVLDIDLLFFNDLRIKRPNLTIPHPKWRERESVLVPLALLGENHGA